MEIESRSYNPGPVFRPRPYVLNRSGSNLMIVTTSWSSQSEAEKVAQMILEQIEQSAGDDVTTLHDRNSSAKEGDRLRAALSQTAQNIYRHDNLKQARILVEALVLQVQGSTLAWAQAGQPNLYLVRKGRVASLVVQTDHSVTDPSLPPLPKTGLGLEAQTPIQSGTVRLQTQDRLICLAQSWEPSWPQWNETPEFEQLTNTLIDQHSDLAFWCGLLTP